MPYDNIVLITQTIINFLLWVQRKYSCDITVLVLCDETETTRSIIFDLALKFKPFATIPPVNWSQITRLCDCLYDLDQSIRHRKIGMCCKYDSLIGIDSRTNQFYRMMFYRRCNINKPSIRQYSLLPHSKRMVLLNYLSIELAMIDMF
jgi:hypothetical protein